MKRYKEPGFQDRISAAARARSEALAKLQARPPVDEEAAAARAAAALARDEARREKQRLARAAADEAKAAKRAAAAEAAAANAPKAKPELTEEERKAQRDARYLARKNRKS